VVNVLAMTPMLDGLADRFALTSRLLLYAPVLAACVWLFAWPAAAAPAAATAGPAARR
jgi:hypothetical protein